MRPSRVFVTAMRALMTVALSACALAPIAPVEARPSVAADLTAAEWREDLRTLAEGIETHHANAFHSVDRASLRAQVSNLDAHLDVLTPDAVVVELMRIAATVGDGHTMLVGLPGARVELHTYGVRLRRFSDGLFVVAAHPTCAALVGGRVVRLGPVDVEEAMARVSSIVPGDNDADRGYRAPFYLVIPEVLAGLGLASPSRHADLEVELSTGDRVVAVLDPLPEPACFPRTACSRRTALPANWTDGRVSWASPVPYDEGGDDTRHVRFVYLEASRTLYVELKLILDDPDETLISTWSRAMAEHTHAERLVLDLRRNHGGDNTLNEALFGDLRARSWLERPGRLFVLIGPETFSAAQNLATRLDGTAAIFVGEPSGGRPNHYGDLMKLPLPRSGLVATASTRYWRDAGPDDRRASITPAIAVRPSYDDHRLGRDAVLDAVLHAGP